MYALKPVFAVPADLHVACSMYKLKNLHEQPTAADQTAFPGADRNLNDNKQLSDQEIEVLLKKQSEVLNVLEELELRLKKLSTLSFDVKDNVSISEKQSVVSTTCNTVTENYKKESKSKVKVGIENLINEDTVIFANPEKPPYSLLALPVLWPLVSWDISYHVHSTIVKDLKTLETIKLFKNVSSKEKKRMVKVFVIWQHINPSPKIMKSPIDVISGEASLLRFFNEFFTSETKLSAEQTNCDKIINEISFPKTDQTIKLNNLINDSKLNVMIDDIRSLLIHKNQSPQKIEKWIEDFAKMLIN